MPRPAQAPPAAPPAPTLRTLAATHWRWLAAIALAATVVRVGYEVATARGDGPVATLATHLLGDERGYDGFAREMASGTADRERAFFQEPLYPWLLARAFELSPPPPLAGETVAVEHAGVHRTVVHVQHLLGVVTAMLVALLGWRCVSFWAGLVAGLLAAVSGPLVFTEAMLLKESAGFALWAATLHVWLDVLQDRGGQARAALLGALLGLGTLLRGATLILAVLVGLSLLLQVDRRRRTAAAAAVAIAAAVTIAPATVHNLLRGDWVLVNYSAGVNLAIGQPDVPEGWRGVYYEPLVLGRAGALHEEEDAVAIAERAAGRRLTGRGVSLYWTGRAWEHVAARPAVAAERVLRKVLHTFHGDEAPDVKDWRFFQQAVPWLATPLSDLRWFGPLAALGFVLLPWRSREMLVLRGSILAVAVSLGLFHVFGRYRLVAAPALWILAAATLEHWRERARGKLAWFALGIAVIAIGQIPLRHDRGLQFSWNNLASVHLAHLPEARSPEEATRRRDAAAAAAREALSLSPLYPEARHKLVAALEARTPFVAPRAEEAADQAWRLLLVLEARRTGTDVTTLVQRPLDEVVGAVQSLRRSGTAPGSDVRDAAFLAWASRRVARELQRPEELALALDLLDQSLRLDPRATEALVQRAQVHRRAGRLAEAESDYEAALAAGADGVTLRNNLGNLLLAMGRPTEALPHLERALALAPADPTVRANVERAREAAR